MVLGAEIFSGVGLKVPAKAGAARSRQIAQTRTDFLITFLLWCIDIYDRTIVPDYHLPKINEFL
jgi:hypothetical protein